MDDVRMAERVRAFDWSRTPLGPLDRWPAALRTAVDLILAQPVAMLVLWGPDFIQIYNDALAAMIGQKHPSSLGRPARETWPEVVEPIHQSAGDRALAGESILIENQLVPNTRHGELQDAWYTYSMGPIRDDDGTIGGVLVTATETTPHVIAERERSRRQALEAVREQEAEYRELFEAMDKGFLMAEVLFDDAGQAVDVLFLAANPAAARLTKADAVGRRLSELGPGFEPFALGIWGRVSRTGVGERHQGRSAALDVWFDFYVFRVGDAACCRAAVVFSDITARKRQESHTAFLRELADDFSHLTSPDEIMQQVGAKVGAYLDIGGCSFVDVDLDAEYELNIGYFWSRSDGPKLSGRYRIRDFLTDAFERSSRAGLMTVIRDTQRDPRTDPAAHRAIRIYAFVGVPFFRDGEWRYLLTVLDTRPRDWRDDELELIRSLANVIFPRLERARTVAELRESEERLRLVVENAHDHAVFALALDGRVATWNPGAARIFGYAAEEIVGRPASVMFTPEDVAAGEVQRELETAAREGRASDDRWQLRKDGTRFWANGVTSAMRDASGHLRGFTKVLRDLTDAKRVDEERQRLLERETAARAEAERAATMRDEFLAVVSHELRTPLAAILLWTKLLRDGVVQGTDQEEAFDAIARSADAQKQLIEDLLDVARMTAGKLKLNRREAPLAPVIRAAIDTVRPMAEAKGVTIELPDDGDPVPARVDPDRVQQVVWNVVNNAVKFSDEGGVVRVELRRLDGRAQIRVQDAGVGIRADFLPHVFERFRQQDASTTRAAGGLGLGLAIARQIVELHGGTIRAESAGPGTGATFTIEFPLQPRLAGHEPAEAEPPDAPLGAPAKPRGAEALAGVRVLLVEDESNTRLAMELLLRQAGATVTAADSADAATRAFEGDASPPDVIISDIGLPDRDGYDLIRDLRAIESRTGRPATPAIALTAYARPEDQEQAAAAGFQRHLAKPLDPATLINAAAALARPRD